MTIHHISALLSKSIRQAGNEPQIRGARVIEQFHEIVLEIMGEAIAKKVNAQYIKNGTLTVAVLSSVVGQELKLREREILQRINGSSKNPTIERLRFLV